MADFLTLSFDERPYDVIAAGGIAVDLVMRVDHLPTHGDKMMVNWLGRMSGGPAPNYACAAVKLGLKAASLSTVGNDDDGRLVIEDFEKAGVATEFIAVRDDIQTPFTIIMIEPSGERSILLPGLPQLYDTDFARRSIEQARVFYIMPYEQKVFYGFAELAKQAGTMMMIDLEPTCLPDRDTLHKVLGYTDIASFNIQAFRFLIGQEPTLDNLKPLLDFGPKVIVVTRAERGAIAVTADENAEVDGYAVDVKDTTGAGDTFNAGFLYGTLKGLPLRDRLRFANAAAALSVTGLGPRGFLPTVDDVTKFLAAQA